MVGHWTIEVEVQELRIEVQVGLRQFICLIDLTVFIILVDLSQPRPDDGILEIPFNQCIRDAVVSKGLSSSHNDRLFILDIE